MGLGTTPPPFTDSEKQCGWRYIRASSIRVLNVRTVGWGILYLTLLTHKTIPNVAVAKQHLHLGERVSDPGEASRAEKFSLPCANWAGLMQNMDLLALWINVSLALCPGRGALCLVGFGTCPPFPPRHCLTPDCHLPPFTPHEAYAH